MPTIPLDYTQAAQCFMHFDEIHLMEGIYLTHRPGEEIQVFDLVANKVILELSKVYSPNHLGIVVISFTEEHQCPYSVTKLDEGDYKLVILLKRILARLPEAATRKRAYSYMHLLKSTGDRLVNGTKPVASADSVSFSGTGMSFTIRLLDQDLLKMENEIVKDFFRLELEHRFGNIN